MFRRAAVLSFCIASAWGAVVKVEVSQRSEVLGGKSFGAAGAYERITGKVWFAVDPKLESNRIIRDIRLAPRNPKDLVEFSADLYMLRPRDPARGNRSVLYEVSNRGGKGMLAMFNRAPSSFDPRTPDEFGDGFLLERGFTLVWLGWQFDVPHRDGLVRLFAPVATEDGKTITGLVRSEFVPDQPETAHSLADRAHVPYAPVNPDDPSLRLTVRADPQRCRLPAGHADQRQQHQPSSDDLGPIHAAPPASPEDRPPESPRAASSLSSSSGFTRRMSSSGTSENSRDTSRPTVVPCSTAERVRCGTAPPEAASAPGGIAATPPRRSTGPAGCPSAPSASTCAT